MYSQSEHTLRYDVKMNYLIIIFGGGGIFFHLFFNAKSGLSIVKYTYWKFLVINGNPNLENKILLLPFFFCSDSLVSLLYYAMVQRKYLKKWRQNFCNAANFVF